MPWRKWNLQIYQKSKSRMLSTKCASWPHSRTIVLLPIRRSSFRAKIYGIFIISQHCHGVCRWRWSLPEDSRSQKTKGTLRIKWDLERTHSNSCWTEDTSLPQHTSQRSQGISSTIQSANIFLTKAGEAKLGDLNVSKVAKNGLLYTQTGTPYYASPEVWKDEPYDSKSDIWSLGCVIYEMTTL